MQTSTSPVPVRGSNGRLLRRVISLTVGFFLFVSVLSSPLPADAADPGTNVVRDPMTRTVANGWGAAPVGGAWRIADARASVADGAGLIASRASGITARAVLDGMTTRDVQSRFVMTVKELPRTGSIYLGQAVRVGRTDAYAARVRVQADGTAFISIVRLRDLVTAHTLAERGFAQKLRAGSRLQVAFEAVGSNPVSLKAKMWTVGSAEPAAWAVEARDASAQQIRSAGGFAVTLYTSASAPTTPTVAIDDFMAYEVSPATASPRVANPEPAPNRSQPVASAPAAPAVPGLPAGVRGNPGAQAPGSFSYAAPATAIYVAPGGSDAAAGSRERPLRTVTAALRTVGNGGTIVLRGGTYHEEIVIPADKRVTIQPAAGEAVWLDGAAVVTGWRQSGSVWIKDGWDLRLDSSPTYARGAPDYTAAEWRFVNSEHPMAAHPDQVWINGSQLRQVASRSQVTAGTFYVDEASRQLVIGSDPNGKAVEASVLKQALSIRSAGTEVRGIGVRRYATSVPDMGTVVVAGNDVKLTDMTIRDNSTTGVYSWALRTSLERVSLLGNGLLGGGGSQADGMTVRQVLSVGNNSERFNHSPVSGAFKVTRTRGVTVVDSAFVSNHGRGPWFDESVIDIVFAGNDVIANEGHGLTVELSERAIVADNIIARNGDFGMYLLNSGNVKVWNNTFSGNVQRNLNIAQDARRASDPRAAGHDPRTRNNPQAPWLVRGIVVSNNVLADPGGNCMVCVQDFSLTFVGVQMISSVNGNLYQRSTSSSSPRWFSAWSRGAASRDPAVTDNLAQFTSATGHDRRSRLIQGETVLTSSYALRPSQRAGEGSIAVAVPREVAEVSRLKANATVLGAQPR